MIITGDIACPDQKHVNKFGDSLKENSRIFAGNTFVFNLEGLIADDYSAATETPVLFSCSALLKVLNDSCKQGVAALANNHTLDIPRYFDYTTNELQHNNILFTGAGRSGSKAESSAHFTENGRDIYLFNYCWDFLLYHQKNPAENVHVAEINEHSIIRRVAGCKKSNPEAAIVVFFHWSIDLETLPYPMYRQFSRALIDSGANIVAGCHSHCVQGGEEYKNGYIIYGLGNFYLPWNVYAGGKLDFPDFSKTSLAFEWNPELNLAYCHWFRYREEDASIVHLESEIFGESDKLQQYSPYQGMTDIEYLNYFKEKRRKKFLIPIYTDYKKVCWNKWLTVLIKTRATIARLLAKFNLIKWQS